jgi:hypothetical protein
MDEFLAEGDEAGGVHHAAEEVEVQRPLGACQLFRVRSGKALPVR